MAIIYISALGAGCDDDDGAAADLAMSDLSVTSDDLAVDDLATVDLRYTGTGFAPPPTSASDMGGPCAFAVAGAVDIDGDGRLDVVVERAFLGALGPLLAWCRGDGAGNLAPAVGYPMNGFFFQLGVELNVVDLDHRGRLDVLLSTHDCCHNSSPSNVYALHDFDSVNFATGAKVSSPFHGLAAPHFSLAIADFDEDGNLDFAAANALDDSTPQMPDGTTSLQLGNGDGTFRSGGSFDVFLWVAAGDFDGDHHADLLLCHGTDSSTSFGPCELRRGAGNGTFGAGVAVTLSAPVVDQSGNRVVDVDGDGHLDLVVTGTDHVAVNFGNGDGTFGESLTAGFPASGFRHDVRVADVDGDGRLELITYGDGVSVYGVARGAAGDGGTAGALPLRYRGPSIQRGDAIALGDFDGDGKIDVVTGDGIMLNSGVWP